MNTCRMGQIFKKSDFCSVLFRQTGFLKIGFAVLPCQGFVFPGFVLIYVIMK